MKSLKKDAMLNLVERYLMVELQAAEKVEEIGLDMCFTRALR